MQIGSIAPPRRQVSTFAPLILRAFGLVFLIMLGIAGVGMWVRTSPDETPVRTSAMSQAQRPSSTTGAAPSRPTRVAHGSPADAVLPAVQAMPAAPLVPKIPAEPSVPTDHASQSAPAPSLRDHATGPASSSFDSTPVPPSTHDRPQAEPVIAAAPAKTRETADSDPVLVTNAVPGRDLVDLNTATLAQLNALRGERLIGRAIVQGRPYATSEDLVKKRVLRRSAYERIKDQITVR